MFAPAIGKPANATLLSQAPQPCRSSARGGAPACSLEEPLFRNDGALVHAPHHLAGRIARDHFESVKLSFRPEIARLSLDPGAYRRGGGVLDVDDDADRQLAFFAERNQQMSRGQLE